MIATMGNPVSFLGTQNGSHQVEERHFRGFPRLLESLVLLEKLYSLTKVGFLSTGRNRRSGKLVLILNAGRGWLIV